MSIIAIVQARMGSTRLPGKILKDLAGKPMLQRVLSRTAFAKQLNKNRCCRTGLAGECGH